MQIVTGKKYYERPRFTTLRDLIKDCASRYGAAPAYRYHDEPGGPDIIKSYLDFAADIDKIGTALHELGLAGKHIVVVGANSYEWAVAHNAIVNGTGVSVPLDRQLPQVEVASLARRGRAEAFIYNSSHHEIALQVAAENKDIRYFICMKADLITPELVQQDPRFLEWPHLLAQGEKLLAAKDSRFTGAQIDPAAMCSLLFTSGTTAMSKGVMLSHSNITANVHSVVCTLDIKPNQRALSVLPLHHTFENTVGMYMMLAYGICVCFMDGLRYLVQNLKEWEINIILAVPLLFENIYRQINKNLEKSGKAGLVKIIRKLARGLGKLGLDVRQKLFGQILAAVGGGLNLCVSGAAPINKDIIAFFNDIGIDFFNGYGLTETSPVISACNYHVNVYGSVGNPLAFVEAAIDTDETRPGAQGEILTRSDSVMLGYFENEAATAEVMQEDGWFRTGDVGFLDKKGCIHITGRAKSMIVLTNGKKVFPEEIEFLFDNLAGVKETIVWGEASARDAIDICAKLVLDPAELPAEAGNDDKSISSWLDQQIRQINHQLPPYKAIKYFFFTDQELIKTTTLKVRRPQEQEHITKMLKTLNLTMKTAHGRRFD